METAHNTQQGMGCQFKDGIPILFRTFLSETVSLRANLTEQYATHYVEGGGSFAADSRPQKFGLDLRRLENLGSCSMIVLFEVLTMPA